MKNSLKLFLLIAIPTLFSYNIYGQMKYQPTKTVVIFLGDQNPTFDEADFPDLEFYYTPDMKIKDSGFGKGSDNENSRAWSSALGVGKTAATERGANFTGEPAVLVENRVSSGHAYILDKNQRIYAYAYNGYDISFNKGTSFLIEYNKFQGKFETESFGDIMRDMVKKGEAMKPPKKFKKNSDDFTRGKVIKDFQVTTKDGSSTSIADVIKDQDATLIVFAYLNSGYDLQEGYESGEGKKGKDYANSVAQTIAAEKQIEILYRLEKGIYGKNVRK